MNTNNCYVLVRLVRKTVCLLFLRHAQGSLYNMVIFRIHMIIDPTVYMHKTNSCS